MTDPLPPGSLPTGISKLTVIILVVVTAGLIAYDVWAIAAGGLPVTITGVIERYGHLIMAIPFAFGLLMGHLFL